MIARMSVESDDDEGFVAFNAEPGEMIEEGEASEDDSFVDELEQGDNTVKGTVLYIGHLPVGFFEEGLKKYFSQFGGVRRVKVARSERTGKPKGYGYVEFYNEDVCVIAARTMDEYMMFGRKLVCKVVPPNKVPKSLRKGQWGITQASLKPYEHAAKINATEITAEKRAKVIEKMQLKLEQMEEAWKAKGIEYSFSFPEGDAVKNTLNRKKAAEEEKQDVPPVDAAPEKSSKKQKTTGGRAVKKSNK